MGRKMLVRILSISLALVFLGVFVPSGTNGAVSPTSVTFEDVAVGSQETQVLNVMNPNDKPMDVSFLIYGDNCGFSVSPETASLAVGGDINVDVMFAPTQPVECSPALWVVYANYGAIAVSLSGTAIEAPSKSLTLVIDGQDTGVLDFEYKKKLFSERLDMIAAKARNHGQYVRWVAFWARRAYRKDLLSKEDMKTIMRAAAHANIPPRKSGLEDLEYDGTPVTDLIQACKEDAENNRQYRRCVYQLVKEMKKEGVIKTWKEKHKIRRYAARLRFHSRRHHK